MGFFLNLPFRQPVSQRQLLDERMVLLVRIRHTPSPSTRLEERILSGPLRPTLTHEDRVERRGGRDKEAISLRSTKRQVCNDLRKMDLAD